MVEESTTEDNPTTRVPTPGMIEVDPQEIETGQKMWLSEKVTTLEKENAELRKELQEMEMRLAAQENVARQAEERLARMEAAITQIADFVQQQNAAIESSRALTSSLVEEVNTHRENFQKVGMIMQIHEQHIVQSGAFTQEMAQFVNALIRENEQKSMRIEVLARECQAHAEVLGQHQLGQQVIAEVIKRMIAGQQQGQQQQQGVTGTGPTVTEVDNHDGDRLDFSNVPSPSSGPPNNGAFGAVNQVTQVPTNMAIVPRF